MHLSCTSDRLTSIGGQASFLPSTTGRPKIVATGPRPDGAEIVLTRALPSLIIYDTGLEALAIGGFDGTAPSLTLAQLQADIRHGLFHLAWIGSDAQPRLRWITTHCTQVSKRFYHCLPA